MADVQNAPAGEVPMHLRDAHYRGAAELGHGKGYRYPHTYPDGWVDQRYLPEELEDQRYYQPTSHGEEREVKRRLEAFEERSVTNDEAERDNKS